MTRYKLTIEYQGTNYSGWQSQPGLPTIQQEIETAITKFTGQDVPINVAGRTDAGVHARGQVAHFDLAPLKREMQPFEILKAINAHLRPQPISIINVEQVHDEFHARFDATNKLYRYHIINRSGFLALDRGHVWHIHRPMDVPAMAEAAQTLLGRHDFTTFRDSECQANTPMRTLDRLDVTAHPCDEHGGQEILIEAEGQSFLHHQVRNMVGTLSLVAMGKWSVQDVRTALLACDRTKGGPTAPSDGLYLVRVDYQKNNM